MATEWYIIYTKENCHMCRLALDLLQVYGTDYYEFKIHEDTNAKEFVEKNKLSVPYILFESDHIGGYFEFKEHIRNKWNGTTNGKESREDKPIDKNGYKIPGGKRPTGRESAERRRSDTDKGVVAE